MRSDSRLVVVAVSELISNTEGSHRMLLPR
jgi:hypothetical protein